MDDLNLGPLIRRIAEEKRLGPTALGKLINTSKQNVYGIFKRKSIDTQLLVRISLALNHDFFAEASQTLDLRPQDPDMLEMEVHRLRGENYLLRRLNTLLEEKSECPPDLCATCHCEERSSLKHS